PVGNLVMAQLLIGQRNMDSAASHLRAALKGNPSLIEANVLLAEYLVSKGRKEEAVPLLETVVRVNPDLLDVKARLGGLYAQTNRLPDALRLAQDIERASPKAPGPHLLKGWTSLLQGNPKVASEAFAAALRLNPDLGDAHRGL